MARHLQQMHPNEQRNNLQKGHICSWWVISATKWLCHEIAKQGCQRVFFSLTRITAKTATHVTFPPSALPQSIFLCLFSSRHVNIQLDDSAFVDHHGFRTSVISSVADGSDLSDFGGGWHLILPSNKEDHPKIFEVFTFCFIRNDCFFFFWFRF